MAYKVITNAENTGLDGAVFPSENQAYFAVCYCRLVFAGRSFEIIKTKEPANTTYEQWNKTGW